jgi:undecaprenyl-diphosphatase
MPNGYDRAGVLALNSLANRAVWVDTFIIYAATHVVFLMVALWLSYVAVAWKTSHFEGRVENFTHGMTAVALGFAIERLIGWLYFSARPFVSIEHVTKLVDRLPHEKAFPSGHATFAFAMAFSLMMHNPKWGIPMLVLAVIVALGRVAAGVHYPTDVMAGMIVGAIAALLAAPVKDALDPLLDWIPLFGKR